MFSANPDEEPTKNEFYKKVAEIDQINEEFLGPDWRS